MSNPNQVDSSMWEKGLNVDDCVDCGRIFKGKGPRCLPCSNKIQLKMKCEFCANPISQTQYDKGLCYVGGGMASNRCNGIELKDRWKRTELNEIKHNRQLDELQEYWDVILEVTAFTREMMFEYLNENRDDYDLEIEFVDDGYKASGDIKLIKKLEDHMKKLGHKKYIVED